MRLMCVPGDMWEEGKSGVRDDVAVMTMFALRRADWMECAASPVGERVVNATWGNLVRKKSRRARTRGLRERFMMVHVCMEEKKRMWSSRWASICFPAPYARIVVGCLGPTRCVARSEAVGCGQLLNCREERAVTCLRPS